MKKIKDGNNSLWWVGKEMTCPVCGAIFQLEQNDGTWINMQVNFNLKSISALCAECGGNMVLNAPEKALPVPTESVGGTGEKLPDPPPPPPTRKQRADGSPIPEKVGVSTGPNLAPGSSWGFLNDVLK